MILKLPVKKPGKENGEMKNIVRRIGVLSILLALFVSVLPLTGLAGGDHRDRYNCEDNHSYGKGSKKDCSTTTTSTTIATTTTVPEETTTTPAVDQESTTTVAEQTTTTVAESTTTTVAVTSTDPSTTSTTVLAELPFTGVENTAPLALVLLAAGSLLVILSGSRRHDEDLIEN